MRPMNRDMAVVLAVHGDNRVYEMPPLVQGRNIYSCEELNSNTPIVYCASPELALAVTKFLQQYRFEFRDGAPIIEYGHLFKPEFQPTRLADARFGVRQYMVGDDSLIAKTMFEALYIIGYSIHNMPNVI